MNCTYEGINVEVELDEDGHIDAVKTDGGGDIVNDLNDMGIGGVYMALAKSYDLDGHNDLAAECRFNALVCYRRHRQLRS